MSLVVLNHKIHDIRFKMTSRQQSECHLCHKFDLMNCHKCVAVNILLSLQIVQDQLGQWAPLLIGREYSCGARQEKIFVVAALPPWVKAS